MQKTIRRAIPIFLNGIRSIIAPVVSILFSYLVIRFQSKEIWGGFVDYLLFFYLATLITGWGSKDFLLRQFSRHPQSMIENWQAFFLARLPVLGITLLAVPFIFEAQTGLYLMVMVTANYISNAFTPVFSYKRDYGKVIIVELVGLSLLLWLIFITKSTLDVPYLVYSYMLYQLCKALLFSFFYLPYIRFSALHLNYKLLFLSFPFFIMGLSGFLMSKIDLYVFSAFSSDELLGKYQIISGFFIFSQSIATMMLLPYVKNIYRIKAKTITVLKMQLTLVGFFINLLVVLSISLVLFYFFDILLNTYQVIWAFFIGYPSYIYGMDIYALFRAKKEVTVLKISVASLTINLFLSLVFLYLGYGITGVLFANAMGQILALGLYQMQKTNDKLLKTHQ